MNEEKYNHVEEFFSHKKIYDNISELTILNYRNDLKMFLDFTDGRLNVNKATFDNFIKYLLEERNEARSTINRRVSAIKSFYNYLYDEEIIDSNSAKRMKYLKVAPSEPKNILQQKEIFIMLDKITKVRDRALMETLYSTGVREKELSELNIENIDFDNELIAVIRGKGKKSRIIPINSEALKWIKAYIGVRKDGPLFLNKDSNRLSTRGIYNISIKHFGMAPHDVRHSFATHLIAKTGNMKAVSELLGHANEKVTEKTYTHLNHNYLKDIYKGHMDR